MKVLKISFLISLLSLLFTSLQAQESNLVDLSEFYAEEIVNSGFVLSSDQTVAIETKIISPRRNYHDYKFSYAWILNADTRKVVWQLSDTEPEDRDRYTATFEEKIDLPAGTYEVYYSTYPGYNADDNEYYWHSRGFFSGFFNALLDDDGDDKRYKFFEDLYDEMYLRVSGTGVSLSAEQVEEKQMAIKEKAFVNFTQLRDEEFEEQIFKVTQPTEVEIYALGEARRDGEYDFGTIINLQTRERVWQLDYRDSENAGGGKKNRLSIETLTLEPGVYKALYVTDDSHSHHRWNVAPPLDPAFWGLTISLVNPNDTSTIALLDSEESMYHATVVEFIKVRDEEYLTEGFTLKRPLDLHIYALGEGRDGDMFDYGWIIDANTREHVWEMKYRDTEPAGGTSKNRMFDGIVRLESGNYIVYYITDDSHSYRDWNDSPPYDEKKWGLSIFVIDDSYEDGDVIPYIPSEDASVLAQIVRIRDNARKKSHFTLENDGYIQVYALGEGSRGEMYDYAWIEDSNTGKVIWEMTYRKTDRAGGAKKNRIFDDRVHLDAGEYTVYYESDDSHSFNDWNARPPRDPFSWGVTISRVDK